MRSIISTRLPLLACMATAMWSLGGVEAQESTLAECKAALRGLMRFPGNTSLPFLAASTGKFDLGYSFQNQLISAVPAKVFGQFDMCQTPQLYSYDAVKTQFCTLAIDKSGICVPEACTEKVLRSQVGNMEWTTFIAMLAVNATLAMPPPCAFDPFLTPFCAQHLAAKDYFENLYQNYLIFGGMGISCGGGPVPTKPANVAMLLVIAVLVAAVALATMCGVFERSSKRNAISHTPAGQGVASPRLPSIGVPPSMNRCVSTPFTVPAFLKAFDLRDNVAEVFSLSTRPGEFSCFDGMRALSCGWVIIYHVILWQSRFINNPAALVPPDGVLGQWWAMPLFNFSGTLCVDTFLFISAFLAMFLLLKKLDREQRSAARWMPMVYINRFLRITPAYMFALFFNWLTAPIFSKGPLAKQVWELNHSKCADQWWRHLLYINTVSPWKAEDRDPQCFGHTWYLADDMMFFYTVPIMALAYAKGGKPGKLFSVLLTLTIIVGCMAWAAVQAYEHNWSPNTWDDAPAARYNREAFEVPWARAPSYFIGILVAFLWYEKKRHYPDAKIPLVLALPMGVVSAFLLFAVMYGPSTGSVGVTDCITHGSDPNCGSHWPTTVKVLLSFAARPAWTIGISLMCMLCFAGQGGPVNHFLSGCIWAPLSFLSYTTYLVHYTVLTWYMANLTARIQWDFFEFITTYLGLTALSHILAIVVALLVEKPCMKLQKAYLEPKPVKKAPPPTAGFAAPSQNALGAIELPRK